jgi:hypothetical protein
VDVTLSPTRLVVVCFAAVSSVALAVALPCAGRAADLGGFWPRGGPEGTEVKITGTDLRDVVAVEFAPGVDARFRIVTGTLVRTWVPAGARTGAIRLSTGSETVSSAEPFIVHGAAPQLPTLASPAPNPARAFRIPFTLGLPSVARLQILDLAGRRVRALHDGPLPAGAHERSWDGLDASGRRARPGFYVARLEAQGRTLTTRMVLVR